MTKYFAAALMMFATSVANAEWYVMSNVSDDGYTYYLDPATIEKNGNISRVWELVDYFEIQSQDNDRFVSEKILRVYDCDADKSSIESITQYTGRMAGGKTVWSNTYKDPIWRTVVKDSLGESLLRIACRR
jgi:hypothetical protein